jgi:hypothetical protein
MFLERIVTMKDWGRNVFRVMVVTGLVCTILIVLLATGCSKKQTAQKYNPESDFEVEAIEGGTFVRINSYIGDSWEVHIPPMIRNLPVTDIGNYAFSSRSLISVTFPDTIMEIGRGAFEGNQLTNIDLPRDLIIIEAGAFHNNHLTTVTFPDHIYMIENSAFTNNRLTNVILPKSAIYTGSSFWFGTMRDWSAFDPIVTVTEK